jgi:hypothetical protein
MDHANTATPARNPAADFYRASGVILIVLGHWLAGAVTYHDGHFGRQNPLVDQPWTQWLTWPFQAVPTFFLVAGYASAVSWSHRNPIGVAARQVWVRNRLARVLGPTSVYMALVSVIVVALHGTYGSVLEYAGWAVAMHLWFLAVYLMVVSLTPIAVAAQRLLGLWVLVLLTAGAAAVGAASAGAHLPYLGWLNYLLCWGALYQLGIAWHAGLLAGYRSVLLAAGSAVALALLIGLGAYPVSMIGVPGQTIDNTTPPSIALLAFGYAQTGLAMTLAPALNRALRFGPIQRALSVANSNVMALYLWHMIPVVIVAVVGYPAGWLPQPTEGTADWWLARLLWVIILSLAMAVAMVVLWWRRGFFGAPLPTVGIPLTERWAEPVMLAGAALSTYGLARVAAQGFAPDGHFPWLTGLVLTVGLVLVALRPTKGRSGGQPPDDDCGPPASRSGSGR